MVKQQSSMFRMVIFSKCQEKLLKLPHMLKEGKQEAPLKKENKRRKIEDTFLQFGRC